MLGFPIRTPSDHSSFDNSPRTIAAYHVLHRLLVPRHPPNALTHLQQHLQTTPTQPPTPTRMNSHTRIECRHHQKLKSFLLNHTPTTPATPTRGRQPCRREIKMLASTMHFSNNTHRTQLHASAPHHRTPHRHTPDLQLRGKRVFPQNPDSVTINPPASRPQRQPRCFVRRRNPRLCLMFHPRTHTRRTDIRRQKRVMLCAP